MNTRRKLACAIRACLCVVGGCSACLAQTMTTTRIAGTVSDGTGAAIVGAEVVAKDGATGENRTVFTDGSGDYVLPSLFAGTYQISISAHGFSTAQFVAVQARISGTLTINAVLKIAGATSNITVTDAPPLLQSTNAEIGMFLDSSSLSAMP